MADEKKIKDKDLEKVTGGTRFAAANDKKDVRTSFDPTDPGPHHDPNERDS